MAWRAVALCRTWGNVGNANTRVLDGSRRRLGNSLLGLLWATLGCAAADPSLHALSAPQLAESVPACLASAPIDLSLRVGEPPVSRYVNDLRLGYARGGAIYLSRPLCELYGWSLCRFVELHEQAHHHMKTVGSRSTCAETLADCWAAMHSDGAALEAAKHYFQGRHEAQPGGYHADADVRLDVIHRCSSLPREQLSGKPSIGGAG